jgi:catechol 2,3-dioxygenase-like lactoylglutathione lyase family enzyme
MAMVKTLGLTHLALTVSDVNRSFQFYHDVFGMLAVYREPHLLQAQTPGLFWKMSPQPKEQHSSCAPHESPTCLQNRRDRQLQPEKVARSPSATAASQRPGALTAAPPRRSASTTARSRWWW